MNEKEIIKKVKKHLEKKEFKYIHDTIAYNGLMPNFKLIDGTVKPMHLITFQVLVSENDSEREVFSIYVDQKTELLEFLFTRHIFEKIDEE